MADLNGSAEYFTTTIDSSRKFPIIPDDSLLTLVQRQTLNISGILVTR
jgi:hypothetical protein